MRLHQSCIFKWTEMMNFNWSAVAAFILFASITGSMTPTWGLSCRQAHQEDPQLIRLLQEIRQREPRFEIFIERFWNEPQVNEILQALQKSPAGKMQFTTSQKLEVSGRHQNNGRTLIVEISKAVKDQIELEKRPQGVSRDFSYLIVAVFKFYSVQKELGLVDRLQIEATYVRNPMLQVLMSKLGFSAEQMIYEGMLRFEFQMGPRSHQH
ncbi:MAG: hypothetical protein ACXWC9_03825 [Pseudobdellovibrionaceae bacterium]